MRVGERPTGRELDHHAQAAVVERGAAGEAGQRFIAIDQAIDHLVKVRERCRHFTGQQWQRIGHRVVQPFVVLGVAGEEAVIGRRPPLNLLGEEFLILQHLHRVDDGQRVVAGLGQELAAQAVRFEFHFAPIAGHDGAGGGVGHLVELAAAGEQGGDEAHGLAEQIRAALPPRMARQHMADLVPDDCRELRLAVEKGDEAAVDEDVGVRRGEGVDGGVVEHEEAVGLAGVRGLRQQQLAEPLHVALPAIVAVDLALLDELVVQFLPGAGPSEGGAGDEADRRQRLAQAPQAWK